MSVAAAGFLVGAVVGVTMDLAIIWRLISASQGQAARTGNSLATWILSLTGTWLGGGSLWAVGGVLNTDLGPTGLLWYIFGSAPFLLGLLGWQVLSWLPVLGQLQRKQRARFVA